MIFSDAGLPGAFVVDEDRQFDDRGWFARTFCAEEFTAAGLEPAVAQCSVSFNTATHTLRGMHLQLAPHAECKLVRCTQGAIFDVLVDLRVARGRFGTWVAHELTAATGRAVYIPEGVAHGFLTLEADTEVLYQISVPYEPASAAGVRWDDPALAIAWPANPAVISDRDRMLPTAEALRPRL
jgi:dTDP-4-dehydrorhamnose 3,5-epimerase